MKRPRHAPPLTIAQRRLVEQNMGLAVKAAIQTGERSADLDDAISAAYLGLMRAAQKFDPSRGVRFSTYATRWIKSFVLDHRENNRLIHVPKYVRDDREAYLAVLDRCSTLSLSGYGEHRDSDWDVADPAGDEDAGWSDAEVEELWRAIAELPNRQRAVMTWELEGHDTAEIARRMGIDRKAVWAARKAAMESLRGRLAGTATTQCA